jgi:hypothetical protein
MSLRDRLSKITTLRQSAWVSTSNQVILMALENHLSAKRFN